MRQRRTPPGLRRRHVLALLTAGAASAAGGRALARDLPAELTQPAQISPAAAFGLFNTIATAGARLVAAGERGRILLSDDSGATWRQVPVPVSVTLVTAQFATPKLGWAAGQMGVILKTTDGGESWKLVLNGITAAALMLAEATADAAGQPAPADGNGTPEMQNAQTLVSFGAAVPFLTLLPRSPTHILALGAYGLALESRDGGETWRGIAAQVPDPQGLHIYGATMMGQTLVAAGEAGLLLHGPAGSPLSPASSPYQGSLFGLVTPTPAAALAFGLQGTVLRSSDLGATWTAQTPVSANAVLCGTVLRYGRVALGDENGNLLLSADAGQTFHGKPGTFPLTALTQAPDGALITGSPAGLRRVAL